VFSHSLFDQSHYLFEKELKRTTQIWLWNEIPTRYPFIKRLGIPFFLEFQEKPLQSQFANYISGL
jgi:hypothetical protein